MRLKILSALSPPQALAVLYPVQMKYIALLLSLLLSAPQESPQEAPLVASPTSCGLGAAFHAGRRAALAEAVGEGVLVFRGMPNTRTYRRFHQDKTFWWLTGIETPNAAIVMDTRTKEEVLFLPKQNLGLERWEGEMWDAGDEWVSEVSGFTDIRPSTQITSFLKERLADKPTVWISKEPHVELAGCYDRAGPYDRNRKRDPLDGRVSREQALDHSGAQTKGIGTWSIRGTGLNVGMGLQPQQLCWQRLQWFAAIHDRPVVPGSHWHEAMV